MYDFLNKNKNVTEYVFVNVNNCAKRLVTKSTLKNYIFAEFLNINQNPNYV